MRAIYTIGNGYILYKLEDADKNKYMELQRQINGVSSSFLTDIMWDATLNELSKGSDKCYSIYEDNNGQFCGCIELQNHNSSTPELGLNLVESKRNQGIAAKVVKLLVQKSCFERNNDFFLIRIKSNNLHSKHVFEKMGAVLIGEECPSVMNKLKKPVGENGIYNINDENGVVYRYKLLPETFLHNYV